MKYIKKFFEHLDVDPFGEEDWEDENSSFLYWLKRHSPDENTWKELTTIDCSDKQLINLKGIENLINLETFYCSHNQLTNLNGIENLISLN